MIELIICNVYCLCAAQRLSYLHRYVHFYFTLQEPQQDIFSCWAHHYNHFVTILSPCKPSIMALARLILFRKNHLNGCRWARARRNDRQQQLQWNHTTTHQCFVCICASLWKYTLENRHLPGSAPPNFVVGAVVYLILLSLWLFCVLFFYVDLWRKARNYLNVNQCGHTLYCIWSFLSSDSFFCSLYVYCNDDFFSL